MDEYLAFVDEIGRTTDGKFIYRLDFTVDTDSVWGDYFNIIPSAIVPNLQPDTNCLSKTCRAIFPKKMVIAKQSYCFSMQDCIDGICPLMFSEIGDDTIEIDDVPLFLSFGETFEVVSDTLKKLGIEITDIEDVKRGDESAIDRLIDNIDSDDKNNDDEDQPF